MKFWVKILIACILSLIAIFLISLFVLDIRALNNSIYIYNYNDSSPVLKEYIIYDVLRLVSDLCFFALCTINVVLILKKTPEIKQQIQELKSQKQAKKKQKLQEKLDKMEKGE